MPSNSVFSGPNTNGPISQHVFNFYMSDALRAEIEEVADEFNISMAELIRQSVRWAIDEHLTSSQPRNTIKRVKRVVK